MAKCEWCHKEFNREDAEKDFSSYFSHLPLSYDQIEKCLCGSCAIDVIEEDVDGVYFETCEECNRRFDYVEDNARFGREQDGLLLDWWKSGPICCDCAIEAVEEQMANQEDML